MILECTHNAGFFSCCSILLATILKYFHKHKKLPDGIDSTQQFKSYKPVSLQGTDIREHYFSSRPIPTLLPKDILYKGNDDIQFANYKHLDYVKLLPFIETYFRPSSDILWNIQKILAKYDLLFPGSLDNVCVLFYRGNDKIKETELCDYDEMVEKAKQVQRIHPNIRFLVQSDETEFFERMMLKEFPTNSFCFLDEIRHMKRSGEVNVDILSSDYNYLFSKLYLAITVIMSRCGHIICTSGNCSAWIMLYRKNARNVHQYLNGQWL